MSASGILVNSDNSKSKNSNKKKTAEMADNCNRQNQLKNLPSHSDSFNNTEVTKDQKDQDTKAVYSTASTTKVLAYVYDKEILLDLRSAAMSLQKPECLSEDFFNKDGVWDPEAWHKSNSSRSASPAVDGKTVVVEGKKIELGDDNIQLAPHRGSFKQGCHVQADTDKTRLGPRAVFEKKNRLTGRAAGQRRSIDGTYDKDEKPRFKYVQKEDKFYDQDTRYDLNEHRRRRNDSCHNDKSLKQRTDKLYYSKEMKPSEEDDEKLPEWMAEGTANNTFDFTSSKDLEEEKKAYAKKKKKVRISPDVDKQEEKNNLLIKDEKSKIVEDNVRNADEKESSSSKFDINDFFNEVGYYPPEKFQDDVINGDGVRSRFTQWFQAQHQRSRSNSAASSGSRPDSGPATIIPDEIITGIRKSPVAQNAYFTPIQPAPALVNAAASAHAVQTSNIINIIQQRRKSQEENKANLEVKGRLSLKEIENCDLNELPQPLPKTDSTPSAFNMLVMSMKEAGQLPEKPAPVVPGLPDHLLPMPPKRTSPTFEKLKQTLNRSPSPLQLKQAVSTLADVISTNPSLHNDFVTQQKPECNITVNEINSKAPAVFQHESFFDHTIMRSGSNRASLRSNGILNEITQSQQKNSSPAAFTPTSVLKQLHNKKQRESPVFSMHSPINASFESVEKNLSFDFVAETKSMSVSNNSEVVSPSHSRLENSLFHSAPTTPRSQSNMNDGAPSHSMSMPATPEHGFHGNPPPFHRVTSQSPSHIALGRRTDGSAFTSTKNGEHILMAPDFLKTPSVGVIGSGVPLKSDDERFHGNLDISRGNADPRLAPGNGANRSSRPFNLMSMNEPSFGITKNISKSVMQASGISHPIQYQSQQQQLLHAQRMAQIQQAQLQQQQKLQQIANHANQQKQLNQQGKQHQINSGIGPLLPDPDSASAFNGQSLRTPTDHRLQQRQQRQQIQAYQQQVPSNVTNNFRNGRQFQQPVTTRTSPAIPMPLQQPLPFNSLNGSQALQNITAQALMQQQLLARARFLAQTQLLQQQPQVLQAALMAQAALARGQAQAQAAFMLNPRSIQAMVEQIGIRAPHVNKAIPTPLVTSQGGKHSPIDASPTESNDLSKWFAPDVLQKIPQNNVPDDLSSCNILSVEELEQQAQRTS